MGDFLILAHLCPEYQFDLPERRRFRLFWIAGSRTRRIGIDSESGAGVRWSSGSVVSSAWKSAAVMGIQAMKAVEIGLGKACAERFGHEVHDAIGFDAALKGAHRWGLCAVRTTRAGWRVG